MKLNCARRTPAWSRFVCMRRASRFRAFSAAFCAQVIKNRRNVKDLARAPSPAFSFLGSGFARLPAHHRRGIVLDFEPALFRFLVLSQAQKNRMAHSRIRS